MPLPPEVDPLIRKFANNGFRYLFRHEVSTREITTNSAFQRGSRLFTYDIQSDGDFYQNVLELALSLHF